MKRGRGHVGGTDHLMSWLREGRLEVRAARAKATGQPAVTETANSPQWSSALPGDRERLRGIPCLAEGGIGGAIRGSSPHTAILRGVPSEAGQ